MPTKHQSALAHQQQFPQVLIRRKEVERLTALSRSRIYDLLKRDEFPKPVRLGAMSVAWIQEEVLEWIKSRIADRNGPGNLCWRYSEGLSKSLSGDAK